MSAGIRLLPPGFEALEPFVDHWAGPTCQQRMLARNESSMEDIRAFYDAMTPCADSALRHVEQFPIEALPGEAARLFCLVLALAQAHVAVELHGQPRAPGTSYPHSVRVVRGPAPYG